MSPSVPLQPVTGAPRERLDEHGGQSSPLYEALSNQPLLAAAWIDFAWALRNESSLSRGLRELVILRTAQMHGVSYQWADHVPMALAAGVTKAQIDALADWHESSLFDPHTQAALRFTEEMVRGEASNEALDSLARLYSPSERIELILTAGFYCMTPRVLIALRLDESQNHTRSGGN